MHQHIYMYVLLFVPTFYFNNAFLRFPPQTSLDSSDSTFTTGFGIIGFGYTWSHASGFLKNCRKILIQVPLALWI